MPFAQLPQAYNPPTGFLFNANNANVPDDNVPTFGRDWEEPYRARRIQQFFDTIDKHSLDTSAAMQADHPLAGGDRLSAAAQTHRARRRRAPNRRSALLAGWDGRMDKERPEPLIFEAWLSALRRIMIDEKTGLHLTEKGPYAAATLFSLLTDHPQWCDVAAKARSRLPPDDGARARRSPGSADAARRRRHERNGAGAPNMSRN